MDIKDYVPCVERDDRFLLGGRVVQKLLDSSHGVFGRCALFGGDCAEGREHCAVNCACIEQKYTCDLMDECFIIFAEGGGIVFRLCVLYFRSIIGGDVRVRLILLFGRFFMAESFQCLWHILWHG